MGRIQNIREKINIFLYNNKSATLNAFRLISILSSVFGIGLMVYFYGFPLTYTEKDNIIGIFKGLFAYYIFSYLIRIVYNFDLRSFFKETWMEGILLGFLMIDALGFFLFDQEWIINIIEWAELPNPKDFYGVVLQVYLFILIALEFGKFDINLSQIRINPALAFMLIFGTIIFIGTGLLMLPEMTNPVMVNGVEINSSMPFLDALFTSTSAACVTGLMTENVATYFSFKGHLVLLGLIKIGGINIIAFGIFFTFFARFGLRVKHSMVIEDILNKNSEHGAKGLFAKILALSILIEAIGTTFLYFTFPEHPETEGGYTRFFQSIFHSVSAFNNAGISTLSGGMATPGFDKAYLSLLTLTGLTFLGSLGFLTILDIIDLKQLKVRIKKPWKQMNIGSKIAIKSTTHLLIIGAVAFFVIEWNNPEMLDRVWIGKAVTALFSVVNRTAGFNALDFGNLSITALILFLILMFIGGASSSTSGGVKTSTMTLIYVAITSLVQRKKRFELFRRNISQELVLRAFIIFFFALGNIFIGSIVLSVTEAHRIAAGSIDFMDILFEVTSAFSSVGLSTGITGDMSEAGKVMLIINMYVGRVGTIMVLMAFAKKTLSTNYKYPDAHIMIG